MLATIVIPTYNTGELLEGCLLSLNHQILGPRQSFDVVVVDDGSTDSTANIVRRLQLHYELQYHYMPRTSHSSRSAARNLGVANAKGDIIVIVDADQLIPPTFMHEHLRFHAASHDLVVIGPRDFMSHGRVNIERLAQSYDSHVMPTIGRLDSRRQILAAASENLNNMATCWHYMFTCNASIRRNHLLAVGGFDENFKGWGLEDSELGYRLRKRGLAFAYNPKAVLYHPFRQLTAELKTERYNQWKTNLKYFAQKYDDAEVAAQFILDRYYNPRIADLDYLNACLRFEFAVRALQGRCPSASSFELVEIDETNVEVALISLSERSKSANLLVMDHTSDSDIPVLIQTLGSPYELDYFRCTRRDARDRISNSYILSGAVDRMNR